MAEQATLQRVAECLELSHSPRELGLKPDEEKLVRSFQLLTLKPELAFLNLGDAASPVPGGLQSMSPGVVAAPVQLELELEDLPPDERAAFAADLGVQGSERDAIIRQIFAGMGRIVFLTVGEDECRTWPLTKGADAVEGAGQIHTDLAKRFVRAEVVSYEEFLKAGSMKEAKRARHLPIGRQNVHRSGWRHHAYFGEQLAAPAASAKSPNGIDPPRFGSFSILLATALISYKLLKCNYLTHVPTIFVKIGKIGMIRIVTVMRILQNIRLY